MTRVVLVGGSGQIGGALRRSLGVFGEVIAPTRAVLDLESADSIVAALRSLRPQIVVNAGAYTAVDKAESEPALAMNVNGVAPGIIAEECARLGAAVVHFSTDYVFDGRKQAPYREEDEAKPLNAYGRSKLAGERALGETNAAYLVLRTSWIYAPQGQNFVVTMRRLAREREDVRVVDDQHGAPTSASQIAEATARVFGSLLDRDRVDMDKLRRMAGLYHVTAAGQTTWAGFARAILADSGEAAKVKPVSSSDYPAPAPRPRNSVLDNSRFEGSFGFRLPDWKVGLAQCLEEIGKHRCPGL